MTVAETLAVLIKGAALQENHAAAVVLSYQACVVNRVRLYKMAHVSTIRPAGGIIIAELTAAETIVVLVRLPDNRL